MLLQKKYPQQKTIMDPRDLWYLEKVRCCKETDPKKENIFDGNLQLKATNSIFNLWKWTE